jgi:hypothetical protein
VESLVIKGHDTPFFDGETLNRVALTHNAQDRNLADDAIRQLIAKGILLPIGGYEEYQLHGPTRDFALSLSQEHDLGLAETIRVEVDEMGRLGEEIQIALAKSDLSALQDHVSKLGNRMQAISLQLQNDTQAIQNIADKAKTLPPGTPLAERYREVLDSFERYVEPMVQLLQRDQSGFSALTERIEDQLIHAENLCIQIGALVSWRRKIFATARYLRTLRAAARESIELCRETLLPLREEYLKNSGIAIAVAQLLSIARKKGLAKAIPKNRILLGGSGRAQRIIPGRFTKAYMANLMQYKPQAVVFPDSPEGPPLYQARLRLESVIDNLRKAPEGSSLLPWLQEQYPEQGEKEHLRLYHELLRHMVDQMEHQDQERAEKMSQHILRYYPHTLRGNP